MLNVTFVAKERHIKKDCWSYKKSIERASETTTSKGCGVSIHLIMVKSYARKQQSVQKQINLLMLG